MTATPSPLLRYLAPLALASAAAMASANWYFEPEKAAGWATALGFMAIMALVVWAVPRAFHRSNPQQPTPSMARAADIIRGSVVFASVMLMSGLSPNFAAGLGIGDAEVFEQLAKRGAMIMTGIFLAFTGNAMPKMLTPLSAAQCDGMKTQAFQRFAGWVWVLSGLSVAIAWTALPLDIAKAVGMTCIVAAMVITATAMLRLRLAARPRTNESGSA